MDKKADELCQVLEDLITLPKLDDPKMDISTSCVVPWKTVKAQLDALKRLREYLNDMKIQTTPPRPRRGHGGGYYA